MKTIFHPSTIATLKSRITQLDSNSKSRWGKMNLYQMLKHCTENEKMLLGQKEFRRLFIGRLFGPMALRSQLKGDQPLKKNSPTHPDLVIKGKGNIDQEKRLWMSLLDLYAIDHPIHKTFIHPFFGKMNRDQIGRFAYKHIDHHLRQFGV